MGTSRGLFEQRYFYTSALIAPAGAKKHSPEAVRDKQRDLIGNEEANAVLFDNKLVEFIVARGLV